VSNDISGSSVTYAAGGVAEVGNSPTAGTNGGGGGAGGAGGTGTVIIRRITADSSSASGGTVSTDGSDTIHIFTSDGTYSG